MLLDVKELGTNCCGLEMTGLRTRSEGLAGIARVGLTGL